MNWLDLAIVALVAWFTISAFQVGFIREVATLIGAVLGVLVAGLYYRDFAAEVLTFIDNETFARIVAFSLIFGVIALAGQLMAYVLKPAARMLQLGVFDQLAGAIFGFTKAIVFVQIFIILFVTYPRWSLDEAIEQSLFGSFIAENSNTVVQVLPDEFEIGLDTFTKQL